MKLAILILLLAVSAATSQKSSRSRLPVKSKTDEGYSSNRLVSDNAALYKRNTKVKQTDDDSSSSSDGSRGRATSKNVDGFLRQRIKLQNDNIYARITNVTRGDSKDNKRDSTTSKSVGGLSRDRIDSLNDSIYKRITNTTRPSSRGSTASQGIEGYLRQRIRLNNQNLFKTVTNITRSKPSTDGSSSTTGGKNRETKQIDVDALNKLFLTENDFVNVDSLRRDSKSQPRYRPKSISEIFYGRDDKGWDWTQPKTTKWRWINFSGNLAAAGCAFNKKAFKTVEIENMQFAECGRQCTAESRCTHFDYRNRVCLFYSGSSRRDAAGITTDLDFGFCGYSDVKSWDQKATYTVSNGCNFNDPSEKNVPLEEGENCGEICDSMFPRCTHFVSNPNSCIIKLGSAKKSEAFTESVDSDVKCGISQKYCKQNGC